MSYNVINVSLSEGQVKKLSSKTAKECGTTIMLKAGKMGSGEHKISLTDTQLNQFNKSLAEKKGIRIQLSKAEIADLHKTGGIFPLLALLPALAAAGKAAALGAVGTAAGWGAKKIIDKASGGAIGTKKKGKGLRLGRPGTYGQGLRLGRPM